MRGHPLRRDHGTESPGGRWPSGTHRHRSRVSVDGAFFYSGHLVSAHVANVST